MEVSSKRPGSRRHRRRSNRKWPMYVMCLCAFLVMGAVGRTAYRAQKVSVSRPPAMPEEIQVGQQLIRQNIRDEFHSTFSPVEETVVEKMPEDKIRVSGWVDIILDSGVSDRQNYSIVIFRNGAGEWVGEKASVVPQM